MFELFEAGGALLETAGDAALIGFSGHKAPIVRSAIAGGIVGLIAQDRNQAILGSIAVGAVIPLLTMKQSTLSSVALCALSAGTGGIFGLHMKEKWQSRTQSKKEAPPEESKQHSR